MKGNKPLEEAWEMYDNLVKEQEGQDVVKLNGTPNLKGLIQRIQSKSYPNDKKKSLSKWW